MKFPADPAKNKYVRDYQVIEFEGPAGLTQGQINTYNFNFPFRFIAEELVCQVIFQDQADGLHRTFTSLPEAPILTQMKYHSTFIDDQPIAMRAAWGTALRPAKLPIPWAVEQGTNISVEAQIVPAAAVVVVSKVNLRLLFSIRGYQPSDSEFTRIKTRNDDLCVRPYQSFTFQNRNGKAFIDAHDEKKTWNDGPFEQFNIDYPMDFFAVKMVAEAYAIDILDPVMSNPTVIPDAEITMKLITKAANLFSTIDILRNIFGTAEFPTVLTPNAQYKQGDFARIELQNNNVFTRVGLYMSLVGYAPKPGTIRRGDIQRGRVKPEQFDPQPMIGGRVQ